ncbi:hypothetical protein [uncultured Draconibacterium sp.]
MEKVALRKGWHAFSLVYKASENPRTIELNYAVQGERKEALYEAIMGK